MIMKKEPNLIKKNLILLSNNYMKPWKNRNNMLWSHKREHKY